jgi:hypothetical protein
MALGSLAERCSPSSMSLVLPMATSIMPAMPMAF